MRTLTECKTTAGYDAADTPCEPRRSAYTDDSDGDAAFRTAVELWAKWTTTAGRNGLMWLIEKLDATPEHLGAPLYPFTVEGRIIDRGEQIDTFCYRIGSLDDRAYVLSDGVQIPTELASLLSGQPA